MKKLVSLLIALALVLSLLMAMSLVGFYGLHIG